MVSCETHNLKTSDVKAAFREIYETRYFTNHGPLAQRFEEVAQTLLGFENVVAAMNFSLALLIALSGANRAMRVGVLRGCPKEVYESLSMGQILWREVTVDDIDNHSFESYGLLIVSSIHVSRLNGVLLEGRTNLIISYDSIPRACSALRISKEIRVVKLGEGTQVQGGLICTDDSSLAEVFRNIRSSYGARQELRVNATCNARFSELQAAIGLKILNAKMP